MNNNNVNCGLMLKLIREKLNLSQAELAERLGIKQHTISRYEKGEREFRITPIQMGVLLELLFVADYSLGEVINLCKQNSFKN